MVRTRERSVQQSRAYGVCYHFLYSSDLNIGFGADTKGRDKMLTTLGVKNQFCVSVNFGSWIQNLVKM